MAYADEYYNLLEQKWIPILRTDGGTDRVGIRAALQEAGRIRQIAASNPMDNVALLRFLLAVLHWCKPSVNDSERGELDRADSIPNDWLSNLEAKGEPIEAFNLLGNGTRFYQHKDSVLNDRPIGDLLVEFPTETKIAHFRHVRDKEYGLCPACCALGIIRFCTFANAYGGGRYTSAVNGASPAYAISQGSTLLETLRLHWPAGCASDRKPPWLCCKVPSEGDLDIVTVFAWRSRRIWLADPGDEGNCAYCGDTTGLIRHLVFTGNWKPPFETGGGLKKFWHQDPHLILVDKNLTEDHEDESVEKSDGETPARARRTGANPAKTTLGFPTPGSKVATHTRFWRRALSAKLPKRDHGTSARVMIGGPAANKGLYQDATSLHLFIPKDTVLQVLETQTSGVTALTGVLKQSPPNLKRQHPNRTAALDALTPSMEAVLRRDLHRPLRRGAADVLRVVFDPVVERIVRSTTPGSPLRRREALERARSALEAALRKAPASPVGVLAGADGGSPATDPSAPKQKRTLKKRGDGS